MDRLKGKTILIGKEPGQGRLLIAIQGSGKTAAVGAAGSVPACVSRCKPAEEVAHAKIVIDQSGNMTLTNMKSQNVTFVNGSEIASKHISPTSTVELGKDRFSVGIPLILETAKKIVGAVPAPPPAAQQFNISHLERVWNRYEQELDQIVERQQDLGRRRMLPIMVGSLSGIASPILATVVAANTLYATVPIAVISFCLYFMNYRKKDTSYDERKEVTDKFTDEYVCPNPECRKFFGAISYKLLKNQLRSHKDQKMYCPRCGCELVEK